MNKLIIALAVISTNAMSAPVDMNDCEAYAKSSRVIMTARQDGVLKYNMLAVAKSSNFKTRVKDAYNKVQHNSDEYKQESINNFGDKYRNKCLASQKL